METEETYAKTIDTEYDTKSYEYRKKISNPHIRPIIKKMNTKSNTGPELLKFLDLKSDFTPPQSHEIFRSNHSKRNSQKKSSIIIKNKHMNTMQNKEKYANMVLHHHAKTPSQPLNLASNYFLLNSGPPQTNDLKQLRF